MELPIPTDAKSLLLTNPLLSQEFELVRNAMYTDPNDQSVWMYHRWLVGSGRSRIELILYSS